MIHAEIMSSAMFALVQAHAATGSRIICSPAPLGTDYDILVLVASANWDKFAAESVIDGWKCAKSEKEYDDMPDFLSFRKGEINLITTIDVDFYKKFDAATHVARRLNLLNKPDRIALFQAVLYANKWEEPPTAAECRAEMRGL